MENLKTNDYQMSSLEEYFDILDRENRERSQLIAKSLVRYLENAKLPSKYDVLKRAQG